ncbi:MAG: DEAD/DEAH box helicase [Flavobacteriales bacterium]|nr:MAG: DEAD/DEAH box helicase [Flavobacteriales bacterium]
MSFQSLGLSKALLKAIHNQGYNSPSPIQEKVIPLILKGKDILASAQTGTGKTAGFTLPMLQRLFQGQSQKRRKVRALIITPTRELAAQVYANVTSYSEFLNVQSTVIFGGVNQRPQVTALKRGVDVLIATPGRLIDLQNQGFLSLSNVEILVLDEADRMLDMGFLRDVKKIISLLPSKTQNLLFSATFSKDIKKLATEFLYQPAIVEVSPGNSTVDKINQKIYRVAKDKKTRLIIKLISDGHWKQVLVFTRTKHGANRLCKKMISAGISAAAIHGNKTQGARTKALAGFKSNTIRVLVATDIAARGLDIPLLPHVINFEIPNISEDYVHRIGRTGRAGASGEALSLVSADETTYLTSIEKLVGINIPTEIIEGYEPDPNASTEPLKRGHGQGKSTPRNKNKFSNNNRNKAKSSSSKRNKNRR